MVALKTISILSLLLLCSITCGKVDAIQRGNAAESAFKKSPEEALESMNGTGTDFVAEKKYLDVLLCKVKRQPRRLAPNTASGEPNGARGRPNGAREQNRMESVYSRFH
jgi:hypothetical protein